MIHSQRRNSFYRGHTLVELVLSLTLLSIVMVSVGSAMIFAANAVPSADEPTVNKINDGAVLDRIAEDLSLAKYVIEDEPKAVTVVVADRTGDGLPDR
ncbi:MAG: prepilin-type N-terminal cleavage/methylation domain-containing protein, partial [Myxococcota bacterium]